MYWFVTTRLYIYKTERQRVCTRQCVPLEEHRAYNTERSTMRTQAEITATLLSMLLTTEQTMFMMYHYNSYANNPSMLRSSKPMIMRDIFLTRSNSMLPNPLSGIYVNSIIDCGVNGLFTWLLVHPVTVVIGWRHALALFIGGGCLSSFAYLFGVQVNPRKINTKFDCACTSNGAFASFAALSLIIPKNYIPFSKRTSTAWLGLMYLTKCTYDEYISPKFVETRPPGVAEVRNWGFVGGAFFGLMYASLFLRTKYDFRLLRVFYQNIYAAKRR